MSENEISKIVVDCCITVHNELGPGLMESVYETALMYELRLAGLICQSQVAIPIMYREIQFENGFRIDILVENSVILELKSVESIAPIHYKQLLTYLRLTNKKLGLLINFNVEWVAKQEIKRVANNL
jgi:GxxExxY protein